MKNFLLAFAVILTTFYVSAQRVQIIDAGTGVGIPFAKVICAEHKALADIDGFIQIQCEKVQLLVQASGYRDTTVVLGSALVISLEAVGKSLNEVSVLTVDEEANRIMTRAADNRKSNHPNGKLSYTYNGYSKFFFTLNPDAIAKLPEPTNDTADFQIKKFFNDQHLFMMESTTKKFFSPPFREKEEVTAYKVSGFSDPLFSTFASELQTFHFYENQFNIFGESYISPVAFGNTRRYVFVLKETIVNPGGDTTFHIRFRPNVDKNFEAMRGEIFINSRNYAIEKVIASPAASKENLTATIIQEYQYVENKWFPYKLSTEASFPAMKMVDSIADSYMIAKGTTYIEDLKFDVDLSDEKFSAASVITNIDAGDKDSTHWQNERVNQLNDREKRTYQTMDSLSTIYKFDKKLSIFSSLVNGKIPLGYVQLDLQRLYAFRNYEGSRLGLGLENSPKLWKRGTIGGYGAYGFTDKAWKYGGYMNVLLSQNRFLKFEMRYQDDIAERGGSILHRQKDVVDLNNIYNDFFISQMDKQRLAEVAFSGYFTPTLGWRAATSYQRLNFTQGYRFLYQGDSLSGFDQHEIGGELNWGIGDKVTILVGKRVVTQSNKPHFRFAGAFGLQGLEKSKLNYQRFALEVTEKIQLRGAGLIRMKALATQTLGDVPLFMLNAVSGTGGKNWNISVPNSFETMQASNYYNDQMLAFFFRYTTKPLKTNLKWTAPKLSAHYAMGTGVLNSRAAHNQAVPDMSKGYYETGLVAENVLILNTSGFGIGVFTPFGALASPDLSKSLTLKVSVNFVLN